MAHYVYLVNWTADGIRNVAQAPARAEEFRRSVESAGGTVTSFLHTMGAYDLVVAVELPSDDAANQIALRTGRLGYVRTTTLKGWTGTEFAALVGSL